MVHHCFAFLASTASLIVSSAGAGILSFPWALASTGLPAFVLIGSVVACACAVGMLTLSSRASSSAPCYEAILERSFGPLTARAATLSIVVQQLGSMVGFLVAIADFAQPLGLPPAALLPGLGAAV
eukprot:6280917-Prymnesium_polylepis.1